MLTGKRFLEKAIELSRREREEQEAIRLVK